MFNNDANFLGIFNINNKISIIWGKDLENGPFIKAVLLFNIVKDEVCNYSWDNILVHFREIFDSEFINDEFNLRDVIIEIDVPNITFTRFIRKCAVIAPDCIPLFNLLSISSNGLENPEFMKYDNHEDYIMQLDKLVIKMIKEYNLHTKYGFEVNKIYKDQRYMENIL